ncbi:hypothetical protein Q4561_08890 [Alteromonas sp. 1_MG-2023]|uniref:hypothetical protein n=1 Tax=Alteromonas sp. 1_MG-2023 TaxID=3062669 RepID=UPI0026E3FDFA|nr:hypothetical protein [Alteromonas sp. 1_MG-2023]MDO6567174.1 hypothetical protein [Alteromonas sp. 1_MG-2023]
MLLSTFQRAVLQEMGIPVWVNQSSLQDEASETMATDSATSPTGAGRVASGNTYNINTNAPSASMPSNEEKQSRLAQLRAQVSSDSSKPASQAFSQNKPAGQNKPDSSSAPSVSMEQNPSASAQAPAQQVTEPQEQAPALVALTQVQRLQGKQWLQDLDVALAHLTLTLTSSQVRIGEALVVTNSEIVLPTAPHLLTASIQKQLWKMLCAHTNNPSLS